MSFYRILILILNRLTSNWFTRRKYKRYVQINQTTRLLPNFVANFYVTPEERIYLRIGHRGLVNARITFESKEGIVEIGDRAYIGGCTIICREKVIIGHDVTMAWGVTIYDHNSHSLSWQQRSKVVNHFYNNYGTDRCYSELDWTGVDSAPIIIEDRVWIGFDAVLLKGIRVGEGSIIAARSVVTRDVESYTVVAGNPAVFVKSLRNQNA